MASNINENEIYKNGKDFYKVSGKNNFNVWIVDLKKLKNNEKKYCTSKIFITDFNELFKKATPLEQILYGTTNED